MASTPTSVTNRDLFATHYLAERLPETEAWGAVDDDELRETRATIAGVYEREAGPERGASPLGERLVEPIFRALGIEPEAPRSAGSTAGQPAYALVPTGGAGQPRPDEGTGDGACPGARVAIADVRRWDRPLDSRGSGEHDDDHELPSYRIQTRLAEEQARWGVLTNGRVWRLYHSDSPFDACYEVDLSRLLAVGDLAAFRYFSRFFGARAFREDAADDCFLDHVAADSAALTRDLGRELQRSFLNAIEAFAEGLLAHPDADLTTGDLEHIYDRSVGYLYRLVFVLSADARGLLDAEASDELAAIRRDVAARRDGRDSQGDLWDRLADLFARIDEADGGFPVGEVFAPASRTRERAPHAAALDTHRVSDSCLADVVASLTRTAVLGEGNAANWYADVDVRRLGSICEVVVAAELAVADDPLAIEDGAYVPASDADEVAVPAGDLYLATDAGERKATGTYYTPEHIVDHVVDATLGPLVTTLREEAARDGRDEDFAATFAGRVFDLDVLDPAMGSGHFLRRVLASLTREIVAARERQAERHGVASLDRSRDRDWVRRAVARRCLYGVDLNPLAVDVAKASLWLDTATPQQSPAFLDHHLRTGDALVGSDVESLCGDGAGPDRSRTVEGLLRAYRPVADAERADRRRDLAATFDAFERSEPRQRLTALANVHTAVARGLETPEDAVSRLAAALGDDEAWRTLRRSAWYQAAQTRARREAYFHWELAFPDVYRARDGSPLDEPGFDAVVGNPPWVATAGRADISASLDTARRDYLADAFTATEGQFDLYVAFYEQAIRQARDGRVGFVVPDAILAREQNEPIREFALSHASLSEIARVGTAFDGVETGAVVLVGGGDTDRIRCADATDRTDLTALDYTAIPHEVFAARDASRFLLSLDAQTRSILEKIGAGSPLGEYMETSRGEEIGKRAALLHTAPTPTTRPIAPGSAIRPYGIDEGELRHIDEADVEKDATQYASPKLVFRQTSDAPVGTFDTRSLVTIKSAYNVHSRRESVAELKHALGVLNSSVVAFYHHVRHGAYRSVFPQLNQSTVEALPVALDGGPDDALVAAVDRRLALTAERSGLELDVGDHLGDFAWGESLADLGGCEPAAGVSQTRLAATTDEWPNLRIGSVTVETSASPSVLTATARYKPAAGAVETDRWGYAETDPIPAFELVGLSPALESLVAVFVPHAARRGGGFADFREQATATRSLLDRLLALRLPELADVRSDLQGLLDARSRARDLDESIAATTRTIEDRVCSLFALTAAERATMRDELADDSP